MQIQETKEEETAMAVMTRSQRQRIDQQLAETFIPQEGDQETPDESNETADQIGEEFPFEEDLFEPTTRTKTHQKVEQDAKCFQHHAVEDGAGEGS